MRDLLTVIMCILSLTLCAQEQIALNDAAKLEAVNVSFSNTMYKGKKALKVMPAEVQTEAKFVKLLGAEFENGTIELEVVGARNKSAGKNARGFVGLAFRINNDNSEFECFYIRPTNGRANDQLRRNHSVQYISYPNFPWHKLRKDTPGKYETYADLVEGEWTKLKIVVENESAKLYVGGVTQPTLLVNDLKLGGEKEGSIGLWVGPGTEAYFSGMTVSK